MGRLNIFLIAFLIFAFNCKKKSTSPEPTPSVIADKQDSIYFVFVNRIGYKNDSINVGGGNMRYFLGLTIESGYYNKKTDASDIVSVAYGRDPSSQFRMKDSLSHRVYPCYVNSEYNLKVYLAWNNIKSNIFTRVRDLTYQLNINGNDTVKTKGNKIIKFVWPDDSASSRFTKTYDGP